MVFLEERDREDLEQCVERGFELEALLDDGDEDVDRDGDPELGFHRVFGCPEELLDPQTLLDPLEEQLDLPSALVEGADGRGRQTELIGDEEGAGEMQPMEAGEIDVAAIHDVDGARFREQQVKSMDVVQLAVRNVDEARDVAA